MSYVTPKVANVGLLEVVPSLTLRTQSALRSADVQAQWLVLRLASSHKANSICLQ